jgi:hypothetical protein
MRIRALIITDKLTSYHEPPVTSSTKSKHRLNIVITARNIQACESTWKII